MNDDHALTPAQQMFIESQMIARRAAFGLSLAIDPDVADYMGAFEETALDVNDAEESRFDLDLGTGLAASSRSASEEETDR